MPSESIHVAANGEISFFFMAEQLFPPSDVDPSCVTSGCAVLRPRVLGLTSHPVYFSARLLVAGGVSFLLLLFSIFLPSLGLTLLFSFLHGTNSEISTLRCSDLKYSILFPFSKFQ